MECDPCNSPDSAVNSAAESATESPCVQICLIHPQENICVGCYRTIEEIANWNSMPAADRKVLLMTLATRAPRLRRRRGGRQSKRRD